MDHRQCKVFPGLVIFLWTAKILSANQIVENGLGDDKNLASYFFYQRPEYPRDCQEVQEYCSSTNTSGLHLIKPDGYPEPFEVYCENSQDSGGWTVIQRRHDGVVYFDRNWTEYKFGFGFLPTEFFLGNDKLSHLTNQKNYELRIDITNSYGMSFYATYNMFRISDELSKYNLASLGEYSGNAGTFITWCQINTGYGNCTCQKTCENPHGCLDTCAEEEICICPEDYYLHEDLCVPKEECGCYAFEGIVIPEGGIYANSDCTRLATCRNGQLRWDDSYVCSDNEVCEVRNSVRQCYCKPGSVGDGADCVDATDCSDLYNAGFTESGVYNIKPTSWQEEPFEVYCNMSDGGGWTVFQRRMDSAVDFYQNWTTYRKGFGSADHEMWLGNEKLYHLTKQKHYTIRIDLVNREGSPYYAKFDHFRIGNEDDKYRLIQLGTYTGTADSRSNPDGQGLKWHLSKPFSTYDQDSDGDSKNCAEYYHGAWWYGSYCYASNLNGDYHANWGTDQSIYWYYLPGSYYNILFTEMKLRPL